MGDLCTLRTLVLRSMENDPAKLALVEGERQYTFQEFAHRACRMGNALLNLGLGKGDRVAVLSRNSIESAESYFSIPNAGLILVMLNFRLAQPEIKAVLEDATPSVLMVNEEFFGLVEQIRDDLVFVRHFVFIGDQTGTPKGWHHYETLIEQSDSHAPDVEVAGNDLAALMYTSGTTGAPKGCMALHRNLYHAARSMHIEMEMEAEDLGIIPTPLFHASGKVVLMNGVYSGTTTIIMPRWDAEEFLRLVERHRVTTGVLATPMLLFLVNHPQADRYDLGSLRKVLFAGAPVTPIVFQRAIERFGNVFIHGFGTTETVGSVSILKTEEVARALAAGDLDILSSCGRGYEGMQFEVVDDEGAPVVPGAEGEIRVRGLGTTVGYWNRSLETRKSFRDGWFYTEDLCRLDDRGFLHIVGRKKEMVITGGENVYPAEVESVLYKHPAVGMAAVIGTPHERWGEIVTAFVVKKKDHEVTEEDIRSFCRSEIAGYKVPKRVFFVNGLPMSASGKLLKHKIREPLSESQSISSTQA